MGAVAERDGPAHRVVGPVGFVPGIPRALAGVRLGGAIITKA